MEEEQSLQCLVYCAGGCLDDAWFVGWRLRVGLLSSLQLSWKLNPANSFLVNEDSVQIVLGGSSPYSNTVTEVTQPVCNRQYLLSLGCLIAVFFL